MEGSPARGNPMVDDEVREEGGKENAAPRRKSAASAKASTARRRHVRRAREESDDDSVRTRRLEITAPVTWGFVLSQGATGAPKLTGLARMNVIGHRV